LRDWPIAWSRASTPFFSEEELLDITAALPPHSDRPDIIPRFSLTTKADHVM
jgi:hypothetical protein